MLHLIEKSLDFKLVVYNGDHDLGGQSALVPPILRHNGGLICGEDEVSDYIEQNLGGESMIPDDYDVLDVGSDLFMHFFRFLKNKKASEEEELRSKVVHELRSINEQLERSGGPFLAGEDFTLADCKLWPKLHHTLVALARYKNFVVNDQEEGLGLVIYVGSMLERDSVLSTRYPDTWVWNRWGIYAANE